MAEEKSKQTQATDYLSQISLDIKEKDLKNNPALVKSFLADLKATKADNLALRDSLKATQDAMESIKVSHNKETEDLKDKIHWLDKDNAILRTAANAKLGVSIIQDFTAVGLGAGIGSLVTGQVVIGLAISVPCAALYIICRIVNSKDYTKKKD